MAGIMSVAKVSEFWRVLRDLNPDSVRRDSERGFSLALLGSSEEGKAAVRRALRRVEGDTGPEYIIDWPAAGKTSQYEVPPRADLFLYVIDAERGLEGADVVRLEQLYLLARPTALVCAGGACRILDGELADRARDLGGLVSTSLALDTADASAAEAPLAHLLLTSLPNHGLAMGRRLPLLRAGVAETIIGETARVNAEFALLSNLPANIPLLGTLMGAGADFLVLTKNQAMMIFKLAAVYGHPLDSRWRLAAEMTPVVGAAFAWRTVSRLLIGALPSFVAALPKAMIAYAGTYVIGKAARYYFEQGQRPSEEIQRDFAQEAVARWQESLAGSRN